ncbi:hypothetical protein PPERSA_00224 [Pseudocohnilembus persalinus]|uniref:Transmembrane protein n=1 Tax=Pseudocohnilembus persalinus TaxID=266149 RepID=A0A0V0QQQ4_PSEPJ|nr:hypothetical protein PPERSA_00224 [Pseudocohnilembus persalinus]|eukprot:KRX04455.1 hypothetical protein PPERSA_00224 [Pseudocohnilembus persalinus]
MFYYTVDYQFFTKRQNISEVKKTYLYTDYELVYDSAYSIQAYSDDNAILYFQGTNNNDQTKLIQVLYNSKGEEVSGYPKELNIFLDLIKHNQNHPWRSFLHNLGETATLLVTDTQESLSIYTYSKDGNKICSKTINIDSYNSRNYYYGIIGDQGWAYLQDSYNEGHFILFDPIQCSINLNNIGDSTQLSNGIVGSFVDQEYEKILMFEFGNQIDSFDQVSIKGNLYEIQPYELNDKDDEKAAFIIGLQTIIFILFLLALI